MPKFPSIPRLSIVIPIGRDLAAFEQTLVSVLENQPADSEVIVAHDGSYDDPFELCDEVRFVTGTTGRFADLCGAGAEKAVGHFVHLLADGVEASPGWTLDAIEQFEHSDVAVVSPQIRQRGTERILAAGWGDRTGRLCDPHADGAPHRGAYLQASFWRRELIQQLGGALQSRVDAVQTGYLYHQLIRQAGWIAKVAAESVVYCDGESLPWDRTSFKRGQRLRAAHSHFHAGGWGHSITHAMRALICNALRPARYAESIGQAFASLSPVCPRIDEQAVTPCDIDAVITRMPTPIEASQRRAA